MNRHMSLLRPLALAALLYASNASAALFYYTDDTTGSPTFNRPIEGTPPTMLSGVGTAVPFDTFSFSVDTAGLYTFRSLAEGVFQNSGPLWDNYLFLYQNSFNPANALSNALIGNDDFNTTLGKSGFDFNLSTGVAYVLVTTGYNNTDDGKYLNLIKGPGSVTAPVPEPETYALLLSGRAVVGFLARRRRDD
jgi:hypothetical protein